MVGEANVHESTQSGQTCHWIVDNLFFFVSARAARLETGRSLYTDFRLNDGRSLYNAFGLNMPMLVLDSCASTTKIVSVW